MVFIKNENGKSVIANKEGVQLVGNPKAELDGGLNPKELIEASLGLCIWLSVVHVLHRDEIEFNEDDVKVQIVATKPESGENYFSNFEALVEYPKNLDEEYKKKLTTIVERGCTIGCTLKAVSNVELIEKA